MPSSSIMWSVRRSLVVGAAILLVALFSSCTTSAEPVIDDGAPPAASVDVALVTTEPTAVQELVIIETPQDRGVLDGPVIWGPPPADDDADDVVVDADEPDEVREPDRREEPDVPPAECDVEYLGNDFTSNRGNALPLGRLQVVLFYDGDGASSPELTVGVGVDQHIRIGGDNAGGPIHSFGHTIETREYALYDCVPNGLFTVAGVVPNGVIDGLAFGLFWRDANGHFTLLKSNAVATASGANFVGMWPLGSSRESFTERTPQITDNFARETARATIIGAALIDNGHLELAIPGAAA